MHAYVRASRTAVHPPLRTSQAQYKDFTQHNKLATRMQDRSIVIVECIS